MAVSTPVAYKKSAAITKSDTVNIGPYPSTGRLTDAVLFGGAGVAVVVWQDDTTESLTVAAGQYLNIAIKRVNSTNTTATVMTAFYID